MEPIKDYLKDNEKAFATGSAPNDSDNGRHQ